MHAHEHFCAVQSIAGALCLLTLRYPAEIRSPEGLFEKVDAKKTHVRAIQKAVKDAAGGFDPPSLRMSTSSALTGSSLVRGNAGRPLESSKERRRPRAGGGRRS